MMGFSLWNCHLKRQNKSTSLTVENISQMGTKHLPEWKEPQEPGTFQCLL